MYVNSGLEKFYKTLLDYANNITSSFSALSDNSGITSMLAKLGTTFSSAALLVTNLFNVIKTRYANMRAEMVAKSKIATE